MAGSNYESVARPYHLFGAERHSFGHIKGMRVAHMPVGLGDEQPAVLVPDPCRDGLEIDACLNRVAYEVVPHAVVGEPGQLC